MAEASDLLREAYGDEPATGYLKSPKPAPFNPWWVEPQRPKAELRSYEPQRPADPLTPLYENLSPAVGAAGMGEIAGRARQAIQDKDWHGLADVAPPCSPNIEIRPNDSPDPSEAMGAMTSDEFRAKCREHAPTALAALVSIMQDEKASPNIRMRAAKRILDYSRSAESESQYKCAINGIPQK